MPANALNAVPVAARQLRAVAVGCVEKRVRNLVANSFARARSMEGAARCAHLVGRRCQRRETRNVGTSQTSRKTSSSEFDAPWIRTVRPSTTRSDQAEDEIRTREHHECRHAKRCLLHQHAPAPRARADPGTPAARRARPRKSPRERAVSTRSVRVESSSTVRRPRTKCSRSVAAARSRSVSPASMTRS